LLKVQALKESAKRPKKKTLNLKLSIEPHCHFVIIPKREAKELYSLHPERLDGHF